MKKLLLFVIIVLFSTQLFSQQPITLNSKVKAENRDFKIPLIGEKAPEFTAESTSGTIHFPSDYGHSWKMLFSHPQDFTPVCSTEILELAYLQTEFDKLGVKMVVLSADPLEVHVQWKKAMESLSLNNREPVKIKFPIIDDQDIVVSKMYGMIQAASNSTRGVRGVYIIDPKNIIQAMYFYPMNVGRSTGEIIRMITALQVSDKENVLMPVNWTAGNDVLLSIPPKKEKDNATASLDQYYNPAWFLWYKKMSE